MSIKDLSKKSFSVLTIRSLGILLLFLFTLFITNFFNSEDVGRYDFARSTLNIFGALALMGTNQSIIYYSGLLNDVYNSLLGQLSIYGGLLRGVSKMFQEFQINLVNSNNSNNNLELSLR